MIYFIQSLVKNCKFTHAWQTTPSSEFNLKFMIAFFVHKCCFMTTWLHCCMSE